MPCSVILKFNTSQGGFTEKWAINVDRAPASSDATAVLAFAKQRLALCGQGAILVSVRITQVLAGRPKPAWNVVLTSSGNNLSTNIIADATTYGAAYRA